MKKCTKCERLQSLSCFYPRSDGVGYRSHCMTCMSERRKRRANQKTAYDRKHYLENKEVIDARATAYYHSNKSKKSAYDKKNRRKVMEKRRRRYQTDVAYKLTCNLRSRLYAALRRSKDFKKCACTMELLGCSVEKLKSHLESRFQSNMTWEKVMAGEIHIDHIKPCVAYDLSDPVQQKQCFHYTNLQPLWARDNFKKSKRYNTSEDVSK